MIRLLSKNGSKTAKPSNEATIEILFATSVIVRLFHILFTFRYAWKIEIKSAPDARIWINLKNHPGSENNLKFAIVLFVLESISLNEFSVDIFNNRSLPNGLFDRKLFLSTWNKIIFPLVDSSLYSLPAFSRYIESWEI